MLLPEHRARLGAFPGTEGRVAAFGLVTPDLGVFLVAILGCLESRGMVFVVVERSALLSLSSCLHDGVLEMEIFLVIFMLDLMQWIFRVYCLLEEKYDHAFLFAASKKF